MTLPPSGSDPIYLANHEAFRVATGISLQIPPPDGATVRLDDASGAPDLTVRSPDGHWVSVHSRRDPLTEAERFIRPHLGAGNSRALLLLGVGLGFTLDVLERLAPDTRVLALEPNPMIAHAFLSRRDWRAWLLSGQFSLLVGPAYATAGEAATVLDGREPTVVVHPVLERTLRPLFDEARPVITRLLFDARANAEARRRFAGPYVLNTLANTPMIAREADVAALTGGAATVPAVIVGAGPSLDDSLAELARGRNGMVLIAADTAARPLLAAEIEPDVIVAVDPSAANARHLIDLPAHSRVILAAEGSVDPSVFGAFAGRTAIFQVSDHQPWPWLASLGLSRSRLRAFGSVVTSAFDLALQLGCDPIVFVGLDLAFTRDRPYARNTTYEHDWARHVIRGTSLADVWANALARWPAEFADDIHGARTRTAQHLVAFRDWLVSQAALHPDRRFINASGGGILKGGGIVTGTLAGLARSGNPRPDLRERLARGRSRGGTAQLLAQALRALETVLAGPSPSALGPIRDWLEFAPVSSAEVRAAVARALRDLDGESRSVEFADRSSRDRRGPMYPTEAMSALRARSQGIAGAEATGELRLGMRDPDAAVAIGLLVEILGNRSLLRQTADLDLRRLRHTRDLPSWTRFPWRADASDRVLRLERELAGLLARAGAGRSTRWLFVERDTIAPPSPPLAVHSIPPRVHNRLADAAARWTLILETADAIHASGQLGKRAIDRVRGTALAALSEIEHRLEGRVRTAAGLRLQVRGSRDAGTPLATCRVSAYRLMRVLTGALVQPQLAGGPGEGPVALASITAASASRPGLRISASIPRRLQRIDPHLRDLLSPCALINPSVLTDLGFPRGLQVRTWDAAEALVTEASGRRSHRLGSDGRVTLHSVWPEPVVGERAWPDQVIAWEHAEVSYAFVRDRAGNITKYDLPFRPTGIVRRDAQRFLWASTTGLWHWTPSLAPTIIATIGPCVLLEREEGTLDLDPIAMRQGRLAREGLASGWRFDLPTDTLTPRALDLHGQAWGESRGAHGWTATSFPNADRVRLKSAAGTFELVCYYPCTLGWAGESLLVTNAEREVLLFRDLAAVLERADLATKCRADPGGSAVVRSTGPSD